VIITYHAIREVGTQNYLPILPEGSRYGHSFSTPVPTTSAQPRLFKEPIDAHRALTSWLRGQAIASDGIVRVTPVAGRHRDKMEIVPVTMELP
jgi:hypothetical protein